MTWLRSLSSLEYIFIGCFVVLYIFYIVRIALIARKMKSSMSSVFYKFFLRSFYFFLLIIALLGPSFGNVKKEIKSISREIYLVVDLSLSMNANDVQPTRLEKAKEEIQKIVNRFPSDKIGVIGFSSTATTLCPPTFDQSALSIFIESLNSNLLGSAGSDLSAGLEVPLRVEEKSHNSELKKVVVLITDGEDYGDKAVKAANELRKNNFKLLILGIGTTEGSKIPFNGTFKKDTSGNYVVSKLEKSKLQDLADLTEGYYYEVNERAVETESLLDRINSIEGTVSDVREVDASANKYLYFLLVALFFIIIDVLITVRTVKI